MSITPETKLRELLQHFSNVMLVTRTATNQLRSRPMALADVDTHGTLWLLTDQRSEKLDEILEHHDVNVVAQNSSTFLSISGVAYAIDDRQKIAELWNEAWKTWFPGGKHDPSLILLKIQGDIGEYWDNSGSSGLKYLIQAGKAYLSGTRPDVAKDPQIHAKVNL